MVEDVIVGSTPEAAAQPVPDGEGADRPRPALGVWWALLAAVAAGIILFVSFPGDGGAFPIHDLWWVAPFGVAIIAIATYGHRFWLGAALGMVCGLAFFLPLLSWTSLHVGSVWLFLPIGEAAYFALLGGLSAVATPVLRRWGWTWPLVTGVLWVTQEALRDRTPFGGFPWGRLAFSQADSPLLGLAGLGGAPLVTFGAAVVGGLLALAALRLSEARPWRRSTADRLRATAAGLAPLLIAALITVAPAILPTAGGDGRRVTVAIVQGNVPRLGFEFNAQRRAVLDNHVNATISLATQVAAGTAARPDLVVWPENASDIDPLANPDAKARIDEAVAAIGVPILVGGLLNGPGDVVRNVGIVWEPEQGATQTYVKRHPVPFAEYMPIRPFARLITDKVDLVKSDFVAGPTPGVLQVGPATVGDVICFEVAYDEVVRDTVTGGAELLAVQTNNATFNVAEARQQLAMVRLRAVEHGRAALMASTVGVSGFVTASGEVVDATAFNTEAVIVRELPLSTGRTMATRLGAILELVLVAVALGVLAGAVLIRRRAVG
jgi:apolipoprotein N-acyltransferase